MSSKRQQTMAKVARERAVKEKRARKLEKRQAKKLAAESGVPTIDEDAAPQRADLNARYVDGGPLEPVADPPTEAVAAAPAAEANER